LDPPDYTARLEDNLYSKLSERALEEYGGAAGQELVDSRGGKPAKMRALESSSALVLNVFEHLRQTNLKAIGTLLDIAEPVADVRFEATFPTGLHGTPPTLDVAVTGPSGHVCGVESKFCEPYRSKGKRDPFAASYFPDGPGLWEARGLPRCEQLARSLRDRTVTFEYLDAPQLLKHALGLFSQQHSASLLYLWYDEPPEGQALKQELAHFTKELDTRLGFRSCSYQDLQRRIRAISDSDHAQYLDDRYFKVVGP
jgi:hypothetical protein